MRVQRDERRWLGGFSLPFSTLYRNGKVRGGGPCSLPTAHYPLPPTSYLLPNPNPNPNPNQVEGRFPLSMPPILLGYEKVRA